MNARQLALFPDFSISSSTTNAYAAGGEEIKHLSSKQLLIKQLRRGDARPEAIETLLRRLRGGSLIVAVLSYDLGVRISNLVRLRIRDVQLSRRAIYLDGRELKIPPVIIDDLREHIGDLLCGLDASDVAGKRDQPLFPSEVIEEVVEQLRRECAIWCKRFGTMSMPEHGQEHLGELPDVATDAFLRLSGRWHKRIALRRGLRVSSPLDLFDKGPRIVRRRTAGLIDAYYMWRATPAY